MLDVLIFDTLPGLFIGIAVSMLLLLYRVSRPHIARLAKSGNAWLDVDRHEGLQPAQESVVVRVEAGLFFANTDDVREQIERLCTPETRVVVLDAETSPFIDVTAAQMLAQLAATLRRSGIELRIARDIGQFRDVMHTAVPGDFDHKVFPLRRRGAQRRCAKRRRPDAAPRWTLIVSVQIRTRTPSRQCG